MIHQGDCLEVLKAMDANSLDACVTDPPYGIGFMGREWDTFKPDDTPRRKNLRRESDNPNLRGRQRSPADTPSGIVYDFTASGQRAFQAWCEAWGCEVLRVLKPGGYLVSFGAPRSSHRLVSGLEDAGFEIRDSLCWLFGSGFPKSLNLGDGRGTALKPAHEPIVLARKPLGGTVAATVAQHGTGALNIDACRIQGIQGDGHWSADDESDATSRPGYEGGFTTGGQHSDLGRWPANVVLDEDAAAQLDAQTGELVSGDAPLVRRAPVFAADIYGEFQGQSECPPGRHANRGGASRFYYCAKPSREERDAGCEDLQPRTPGECTDRQEGSAGITPYAGAGRSGGGRNFHPTVKPIALMRWLVRLVTPPNGTVVDPFMGSGTTGAACLLEQRQFVGIEREAEYVEIARRRIHASAPLFAMED